MAGSATQKIAEKLAARQAANGTAKPKAAAPEPEPDEAEAEPEVNDDLPVIDEDDELLPEEAPKRGTLAQKQAAAKAAKAAPAKPTPKGKTKVQPSDGKKPASPAQLAAREAFAAKSRERAAAKAAATKAAEGPVQTESDVRSKQSANRKAANEARATASVAKREPTSKPVVVKAPKTAAPAVKAKATKTAKKAGSKAADKVPSERTETGNKVRALAAKGKTRRQIMDELELSYASVFYHTRGLDMSESSRGSVFVETNLDAEGKKLRGTKKETVSRSEAMRRDYRNGMDVGDIARKWEVRYQIAYTACRNILNRAAADDE